MKKWILALFFMGCAMPAFAEAPPTPSTPAVPSSVVPAASFLQKFDKRIDETFKARPVGNTEIQWKVGGQSRYRLEYRDDFNLNDTTYEDDALNLLRHRLNLDLKYQPQDSPTYLRFFSEGQTAQSFAESSINKTNAFANELDLRQLFVETKSPWKEVPLTVKAGRQVLSYGDERFVGGFEWSNVARVFDAVKLIYNPWDGFQLDVFFSQVVLVDKERADDTDHADNFYGVYGAWKIFKDHVLDTFLFIRHDRDNEIVGERTGERGQLKEYTFGNRFKGKKFNFDYGTEYAVQLGSRAHDNIAAWAFHQELGYTFVKLFWTPRFYGEYNHASGDRNPTDGTFSTFDNLFPTNHNKYGYIDFISLKNINDFMVGASVKPHARVLLSSDFHWFVKDAKESAWFNAAGGTFRAANVNASSHIGNELDLLATYKMTEHLNFMLGYSHFFAGPFAEDTGTSDDANFFYFQTLFTF